MSQAQLDLPMDTLRQARLDFLDHLDEGTTCPCCGRFAKRYKRKLNSGIARAAIWFYRRNEGEWFNMESELRSMIRHQPSVPRSGDPAKLRHWDLLEKAPKANKAEAGLYRLTGKGTRFVLGWVRVPRHVFIFDDRREGFSDDSTDIREALGDRFNYAELMSG